MADGEDIQPLVCDNGTGMVKVLLEELLLTILFSMFQLPTIRASFMMKMVHRSVIEFETSANAFVYFLFFIRLVLPEMMPRGPSFQASWVDLVIRV